MPIAERITASSIAIEAVGTNVNTYGAVTGVGASTPTSVVTYTPPAGKTAFVKHISLSGDNVATYTLKFNGADIDKKHTHFGNLTDAFFFEADENQGLIVTELDILKVEVVHERPEIGAFNARIQSREV